MVQTARCSCRQRFEAPGWDVVPKEEDDWFYAWKANKKGKRALTKKKKKNRERGEGIESALLYLRVELRDGVCMRRWWEVLGAPLPASLGALAPYTTPGSAPLREGIQC